MPHLQWHAYSMFDDVSDVIRGAGGTTPYKSQLVPVREIARLNEVCSDSACGVQRDARYVPSFKNMRLFSCSHV